MPSSSYRSARRYPYPDATPTDGDLILKPFVEDVSQALTAAGVAVGWIPRTHIGVAHELAACELVPLRGKAVEMAPLRSLFSRGAPR